MSRATESLASTAYARTREHLAYLGLATASEYLAAELERGKDEASAPVEVMERLLAAEVTATAARRLSGRLRFAHYPLDKRLAQFEFDFQPSIDRAVIAELSTLRFVEERRNALFLGPPGVGKSHLAIALGIAATEAGYRTYFTTAVDLVAHLQAAHLEGSWASKMRTYTGPSVLVIDELGYLPMDATSAHATGARSSPIRWWRARSSIGSCTTPPSSTSRARAIGCGPTSRHRGRPLLCSADLDRLCIFRGDLSAPLVLSHRCNPTRRPPCDGEAPFSPVAVVVIGPFRA